MNLYPVVFVINAPGIGGAERHTDALAQGLAARGFAPEVFALKRPGKPQPIRRRIDDLRALMRRRGRALAVAVNERPALIAALAVSRHEARLAAILHSTLPRTRSERWLRFAHVPALYALDKVVFVSERQRAHWRRSGFCAKAETIRNGVDLRRFTPQAGAAQRVHMRTQLGFAESDVVAVFCTVLRPEKFPSLFLDALAGLRASGAPLKGLIVGDGPLEPLVRARLAELGLQGAVSLAGLQPDVRPYLAAADFGVNCSVSETLSLAALEAMAMGLPMVMSDVGGAAEIVDTQCGALFPSRDVAALKAALAGFIDVRRRREAGFAARARVVAEFDENAMFDRYADTFSRLLA